jgi:2-(3-amino-3-carboxypropyl)histidine synthase
MYPIPVFSNDIKNISLHITMEDDRAAVDLGVAADLEESQAAIVRQPKKRFVGRRQATQNAAAKLQNGSSVEDTGAIQS